ncbi:hypothetical protein D9757_010996 [Collybiopsis confluens]|uniref:Uncharacterized protein n=1 Tax=Collybiopsis confluens TaxID=2823264 RepID=A0A8H5LMK8_9AGAR|nr:hypothetical protein D9757_010996 [Collybiopsis confluens]
MSMAAKFTYNKAVEERNNRRRIRVAENPALDAETSDVESFITVNDHMQEMVDNPSLVNKVFHLIPPAGIAWLKDMIPGFKISGNTPQYELSVSTHPVPSSAPSAPRKPKPDFTPKKMDDIDSDVITTFPPALLHLEENDFVIPLAWFVPKNLRWITANLHNFKRTKLTYKPEKPQVLDIDDVKKKMDAAPDVGPSNDSELDYIQWKTATENHLNFEVELYGSATASRPTFLARHYNFFDRNDASSTFQFWQGYEIELRKKHYEELFEFERSEYMVYWTLVKSAEEYSKRERTLRGGKGAYNGSNSYRNHPVPSTSYPSSRYAPYPSSQPFPSSSESRPKPRCVGCGKVGHKLGEHRNTEHGVFPFATSTPRGDLVTSSGTKICIWFNIHGECRHTTCSSGNRICSLCGGHHHALGKSFCPNRSRE